MHFLENSMFVLNVYFCCELRFVATYAPNSDFYSEIQQLTQILLRISEEKFGGWSLWSGQVSNQVLSLYHHGELGNSSTGSKWEGFDKLTNTNFTVYVSLIKLNLRNVQEYFAITWNSNTTEIIWFDSDFAQTIWAKICWVGALLVHLLYFRVSTSDRPCAHHRRAT